MYGAAVTRYFIRPVSLLLNKPMAMQCNVGWLGGWGGGNRNDPIPPPHTTTALISPCGLHA